MLDRVPVNKNRASDFTVAEHTEKTAECAEFGRMLRFMIKEPEKFLTSDL